jgi:hypothetical protein
VRQLSSRGPRPKSAAAHASTLEPTSRIELAQLPVRQGDRWPLLGSYVDLVWTEILGVTTTAVARRLGHLLTCTPPVRGVSLDVLATPLAISPRKALDALRRLHHFDLIEFREHAAVIGASGFAPPVPPERAATLSAYTARLRLAFDECPEASQDRAISGEAAGAEPRPAPLAVEL